MFDNNDTFEDNSWLQNFIAKWLCCLVLNVFPLKTLKLLHQIGISSRVCAFVYCVAILYTSFELHSTDEQLLRACPHWGKTRMFIQYFSCLFTLFKKKQVNCFFTFRKKISYLFPLVKQPVVCLHFVKNQLFIYILLKNQLFIYYTSSKKLNIWTWKIKVGPSVLPLKQELRLLLRLQLASYRRISLHMTRGQSRPKSSAFLTIHYYRLFTSCSLCQDKVSVFVIITKR